MHLKFINSIDTPRGLPLSWRNNVERDPSSPTRHRGRIWRCLSLGLPDVEAVP